MQHETCVTAIHRMRAEKDKSNVHTTREECRCEHAPTPCHWVGNDTWYACLEGDTVTAPAPQRVYTHTNGTKVSRVVSTEPPVSKLSA